MTNPPRSRARPDAYLPHILCAAPPLGALLGLYFAASLAHFAHNAEYIAYYPNMPAGLTREHVYLVWLAITAIGAAGLLLVRLRRWRVAGAVLLVAYGATGLDGLGHYALALCSEHSFAANATIWSEAVSGVLLALAALALAAGRWRGSRR